jgi:hypothetical protein
MGRFSKVILKRPPPKFRKVLQKIPMITLIAISIALSVSVKIPFLFIKKSSFPKAHIWLR